MWKAWSEFLIAPTNKNPCFWNNVTDWLTISFHYKLRTFFGCLCHSSGSSSELSDSDSSSSLELVSISSSLSNISGCPTDSVGTVSLWCVFVFSQFTHSQRDVQAFLFFLQLQRLVLQPLLLHLHFRMIVSNTLFCFCVFSLESACRTNPESSFSQPYCSGLGTIIWGLVACFQMICWKAKFKLSKYSFR